MTPAAALTLALALAPGQADAVTLKWKLAKGDVFYSKNTTELTQTVEALGNKMNQEQTQTVISRMKVLEAAPDKLVLEQMIVRAESEGNLPGTADSMKKMKGATLTYTLDKDNRVTKVEGYDKFLDQVSDGNEQVRKLLEATLTQDTLKVTIEDMLGVLPAKPVKVGDTWKRDTKLSLGPIGDFALAATYKYAGPADGAEKITLTADAKFSAPRNEVEGLPFKISKGELKAEEFTGTLLFDPKAGRLKSADSNVKMGGTLTVSVMGQEIDITFTQKLKTTSQVSDTNPAVD